MSGWQGTPSSRISPTPTLPASSPMGEVFSVTYARPARVTLLTDWNVAFQGLGP